MSLKESLMEAVSNSEVETNLTKQVERFMQDNHSRKSNPEIDLSKDGETHIWVSPVGETKIGRLAYLNWRSKFYVPQLGNFGSVANFSRWVITFDELVRFGEVPKSKVSGKDIGLLVVAANNLGKYHQLCAYLSVLLDANEKGHFDLPWYGYKRHRTGVKELQKRKTLDHINLIKYMALMIVRHGPKDAVKHIESLEKHRDLIMQHVINHFGDNPISDNKTGETND